MLLRKKALNKIFITTITLFTILTLYLIPNINNSEVLDVNLEVEYVSGVGTNTIYLMDKNNYLVKVKTLITSKKIDKKISTIINKLIINKNNSYPDKLSGTIPSGVKLLSVEVEDNIAILDFSRDILKVDKSLEDRMFESIVFSLLELKEINGVKIKVEGEYLGNYPVSKKVMPNVLDKNIGINKEYELSNRKDIQKIVVYYLEDIDNVKYYVPVTKYLNDSRDKVKIVIDKLTTSYIYEDNLMSLLSRDVKLNSYSILENVMFIDFNNSIFANDKTILEEVVYSISYSIFDNYEVESVLYTVDGEEVKSIKRSDL